MEYRMIMLCAAPRSPVWSSERATTVGAMVHLNRGSKKLLETLVLRLQPLCIPTLGRLSTSESYVPRARIDSHGSSILVFRTD